MSQEFFQESGHFSSSDVNVYLKRTAASPLELVDVAFLQLTAGETPIHIWNYARRQLTRETGAEIGQQGGTPFDDTALSHHQATVQLMANVSRFSDLRSQVAAMTEIHSIQIIYSKTIAYENAARTGYVLEEGNVSQIGQEVTVGNAVYPTITITFRKAKPYSDRITLETPQGRDVEPVETSPDVLFSDKLTPINIWYNDGPEDEPNPKKYHPQTSLGDGPFIDLMGEHEEAIFQELEDNTDEAVTEAVLSLSFKGGVIVSNTTGLVFVWNRRGAQYAALDDSAANVDLTQKRTSFPDVGTVYDYLFEE